MNPGQLVALSSLPAPLHRRNVWEVVTAWMVMGRQKAVLRNLAEPEIVMEKFVESYRILDAKEIRK